MTDRLVNGPGGHDGQRHRACTAFPAEPLLASLAMLARLGSSTRVSAGRAGLPGAGPSTPRALAFAERRS
jgi:hypothetical protein